MAESITQKTWLDYIAKINDRNRARQRDSGFTTWAIVGLAGVLFYKLLDELIAVPLLGIMRPIFLVTLTGAANAISLGTLLFMLITIKSGRPIKARFRTKLDKITDPYIVVPLLFIVIVLCSINIYTGLSAVATWRWRLPYYSIGLFYGLNFITPIILLKKNKVSDEFSLPIGIGFFNDTKANKKGINFALSGLLVLNVINIISLSHALNLALFDSEILKVSLEINVVAFFILYLCFRFAVSAQTDLLEDLERRIVVDNLSPEEIRSIFIKEYLGETVRDWLAKVEQTLKSKHDHIMTGIIAGRQRLEEIRQKENVKILRDNLCASLQRDGQDYFEFSQNLKKQLTYLSNKLVLTSEKELLDSIASTWDLQVKQIQKTANEFCAECQSFIKRDLLSFLWVYQKPEHSI